MKKKVLAITLATVLALSLGLVFAGPAGANPDYIETLYLTDSLGAHTHDGSRLYSVEIDDVNNWAVLTMLLDETDLSDTAGFDQVDAIAASPDGGIIYLIDSDTGNVGCYNVGTDAFSILPNPTGKLTIVLAACSSDGTLYAARNADDSLYTIDTTTGVATLVGPIKREVLGTKYTVDVSGADIVFGEGGVLYFWANTARTNAPEGLYTLTIPGTPGDVMAVYHGIVSNPTPGFSFTGLAIRGGGAGDLLASAGNDNIYLVDKSNGQLSTPYEMRLGGAHYSYSYGDMTIGELGIPSGKCGDLIAGQHYDAGDVNVWDDGTNLYVQYVTTDGWMLTETHLDVATSPEDIPQTKNGNPIPGHFAYSNDFDPAVDEYTYVIPLDGLCGNITIAAHAVVIKVIGDGSDSPFWATSYTTPNQGQGWNTSGDSVPVISERSDPSETLGPPDASGPPWSGFYSLGENGDITVSFGYPIFNGDGEYDISVHETSGNRGDPTEDAKVYVIVNGIEYFAGNVNSSDQGNGVGTVSIPDNFTQVDAVKLVDNTDKSWHLSLGYAGDGYDIDAVDACYLVEQEETAWGWCEDNGGEFSGNNWATYITYDLPPCP